MPGPRHTLQAIILSVLLGAALIAEAAVLYFGADALLRLGLGLLLLAIIMYLSAKLGIVSRIAQSLSRGFKRRSYVRLRTVIDQFLSDVRRLNWAAAGAERGFRNREEAEREIDALEGRLHDLVKQIRTAAGHVSQDAEAVQTERIEA